MIAVIALQRRGGKREDWEEKKLMDGPAVQVTQEGSSPDVSLSGSLLLSVLEHTSVLKCTRTQAGHGTIGGIDFTI